MPRKNKYQAPPGLASLPFADPQNVIEHIQAFGNDDAYSARSESTPTDAEPGSPEKIETMAARLAAGQDIWSDDDAKIDLSKSSGIDALLNQLARGDDIDDYDDD